VQVVECRAMGAHEEGCVWRGGGCRKCGFDFVPGESRVSAPSPQFTHGCGLGVRGYGSGSRAQGCGF